MKVTVICIGKLKEKYLKEAICEYSKRISRFAKLDIIELPDEKIPENAGEKLENKVLSAEGDLILSKINQDSVICSMCIEGRLITSEELAETVESAAMAKGHITFIIGGSLGLDERIKKLSQNKISFGRITLPHQLMRVVLLEQIYRAFKINAHETYHK